MTKEKLQNGIMLSNQMQAKQCHIDYLNEMSNDGNILMLYCGEKEVPVPCNIKGSIIDIVKGHYERDLIGINAEFECL